MPQPTQCLGCGKVFKNLRRHQQRWQCHGQDPRYPCEDPECIKTYASHDMARSHYVHKNLGRQKPSRTLKQCEYPGCDIQSQHSGPTFKTSGNSRKHIQFPCEDPECDKMYLSQKEARSHYVQKHSGRQISSKLPKQCEHPGCGKVLSSFSSLRATINLNTPVGL